MNFSGRAHSAKLNIKASSDIVSIAESLEGIITDKVSRIKARCADNDIGAMFRGMPLTYDERGELDLFLPSNKEKQDRYCWCSSLLEL